MKKEETRLLKGIAILMMLWLHLFTNADYINTHCINFLSWGHQPLAYALTKIASMCVPIYIILGGYGLAATWKTSKGDISKFRRIFLLYTNFWIIFIIFIPLGIVFRPDIYPGSLKEFLLNTIAASSTYNGAWWFLLPYILLVLCSQSLIKIVFNADNRKTIWIMFCFLILYIAAYVAKDYIKQQPEILPSTILTIVNVLYILFIFSAGILSYKYDIISRLRLATIKQNRPYNNIAMYAILILLCILRMSIGNSALLHFPFVCLIIPLIVLLPKPHCFTSLLLFFGKHSTNMWLCHYFFINSLFNNEIYLLRFPLLIWGALILSSLIISIIVNVIFLKVKTFKIYSICRNK